MSPDFPMHGNRPWRSTAQCTSRLEVHEGAQWAVAADCCDGRLMQVKKHKRSIVSVSPPPESRREQFKALISGQVMGGDSLLSYV